MNTVEKIAQAIVEGVDISEYGCIKSVENGDLVLLSYTAEAQWVNEWNETEQLCRGLIINKRTGEIVARPFKKFFNYGQDVNGKIAIPGESAKLVNVFEKLDGSLGILYRDNGVYKIATRGSFDSDQAQWATNFWNDNYSHVRLGNQWTLLFEIIYPENRIVVDYNGIEDIVLLAVIDRFTGEELDYSDLEEFSVSNDMPIAANHSFFTVEDVLRSAKDIVGTDNEGYVLLYDDGSRFKIKGDDYVWLHRIISNISKKNVFEMWVNDESMPNIPDEFIVQIEAWYDEFSNMRQMVWEECLDVFESSPKDNRKEFAMYVKSHKYSSVLFLMYDERDIHDAINRIIKQECGL